MTRKPLFKISSPSNCKPNAVCPTGPKSRIMQLILSTKNVVIHGWFCCNGTKFLQLQANSEQQGFVPPHRHDLRRKTAVYGFFPTRLSSSSSHWPFSHLQSQIRHWQQGLPDVEFSMAKPPIFSSRVYQSYTTGPALPSPPTTRQYLPDKMKNKKMKPPRRRSSSRQTAVVGSYRYGLGNKLYTSLCLHDNPVLLHV